MIGAYPTVAHAKHTSARRRTELDDFVRWEYGPGTGVAAFLADAAQVSEKARTKDWRRIANGLRTLARAFGSVVGRRSAAPNPEV